METRNSLTKALQQMGFAKAVSKKENETVAVNPLIFDSSPPFRAHGLWFEVELAPGEEKILSYYKFMLSNWTTKEELISSAVNAIKQTDNPS